MRFPFKVWSEGARCSTCLCLAEIGPVKACQGLHGIGIGCPRPHHAQHLRKCSQHTSCHYNSQSIIVCELVADVCDMLQAPKGRDKDKENVANTSQNVADRRLLL